MKKLFITFGWLMAYSSTSVFVESQGFIVQPAWWSFYGSVWAAVYCALTWD